MIGAGFDRLSQRQLLNANCSKGAGSIVRVDRTLIGKINQTLDNLVIGVGFDRLSQRQLL